MKRFLQIILLIALGFVLILILQPGSQGETGAPVPEGSSHVTHWDWTVEEGDDLERTDDVIYLHGNLHVYGTLALSDTQLFFNCTYNGEYGILVMPGGKLEIQDGSVVSAPAKKHFTFEVQSDKTREGSLTLQDSSISHCGYRSTIPENTGLFSSSGLVSISHSEITDSYYGLVLSGIKQELSISNMHFTSNERALILESSCWVSLTDSQFTGNDHAIIVTHSSDISIDWNRFSENIYAVQVDNSTKITLQSNEFERNKRIGISLDNTNDIQINGNTINSTRSDEPTDLGTGLILRTTSGADVQDNTLFYNDIGMMMLHNNSETMLQDMIITGGRLGMYLYHQDDQTTIARLAISDTTEAVLSARYCTDHTFEHFSAEATEGLMFNISTSSIDFTYPEISGGVHRVDDKSTIRLFNDYRIHTVDMDGNPISSCEVSIKNQDDVIYATPAYGGVDPETNVQGYTDTLMLEYSRIGESGPIPSETVILTSWKEIEISKTIKESTDTIIRFYFRIPDLSVKSKDIIISTDQEDEYSKRISVTVTNIGTTDITASFSLYLILGSWEFGAYTSVDEISLPRWSDVLMDQEIEVKERGKRTLVYQWTPEVEGDHTFVVIINEDSHVQELKMDNNAALKHMKVSEDDLLPPETANIRMTFSQSLDGTNLSSRTIDIGVNLFNEGEIAGSVILVVTLFQGDETYLIFNQPFTISPNESEFTNVPVTMDLGDAFFNFTLLPKAGEKALEILTPYLSMVLHVHDESTLPLPAEEKGPVPEVVMYSIGAGIVSFIFAYIAFAESARYRFLMLFFPLYMRMSKKDIEEQYTRGEILGYVKQNPGESYNNIKRDLEMSNGKLAYHLSVLEKGGFIKSVTDGMYRRYYPKKMKVTVFGRITSVQEEIMRRIEETPGISQKDLSRLVELSTATINYHIRKLTTKGLLVSKRKGIFVQYYLNGMTVDEIMANAIPQHRAATTES